MQVFSIRDMERLTGIRAHTLRVWEQRHGLVMPHRKDSNHRYYTNEDLQKILRVAWLYHRGHKISHIAALSDADLSGMVQQEVESGQFHADTISLMLKASRDFDEAAFKENIHYASLHLGFEKAVVQVFYPYLEKIGLLWMNDDLLPAQEHFGSAIILHAIIHAINDLPNIKTGRPPILLFAPAEEHHEIPLFFIEYLLRKNGQAVVNFGCNTPDEAVEAYARSKSFSHLHYHQVTNFTNFDVDEYLEKWCHYFAHKRIVVSGRLAVSVENPPPNASIIRSMEELINYTANPG